MISDYHVEWDECLQTVSTQHMPSKRIHNHIAAYVSKLNAT